MAIGEKRGIGQPVLRTEDRRFLLGRGNFTDDHRLEGQRYAAFVRSPVAHANIVKIDAADAREIDGFVTFFTGQDLLDDDIGPLPSIWEITNQDGTKMHEPPRRALAVDKVCHVGDAVAMVIATSPSGAREAAELVDVEYDVLDPVVSTARAISQGGTPVHEGAPNNICFDWGLGDSDAVDIAFASAKHIVKIDLVNTRVVANPMEPRSALANFDSISEAYTLYTTSQAPHLVRTLLCGSVLKIPEQKMRVIAPDVGGGFGVKCYHYPEEVLVSWAARKCGTPIKWTADRSEGFLSDAHARDHVTHAELALDENGTFLGMRVDTIANLGAYLSTWGPSIPTYLSAPMLAGQYKTPAIHARVRGVFTNTLPVDAYRGAGRPEANYVIERLIDTAAQQLGMDRVEIRRRNMIPPEAMPYQTPVRMCYDSGHFEKCLDMALREIGYSTFEKRRIASEKRGKRRGIGFSCYIEACGLSPSRGADQIGARLALYESAEIRFNPDASVSVFSGAHSHGQGHATVFAQIVSDKLGVPFDRIEIIQGDTDRIPFGLGTYGSRSAAVGGSAISVCADRLIEKGKKIAAHMLNADLEKIEFSDGVFGVKGTNLSLTIGDIVESAYKPYDYPLETLDPGMDEMAFYDPENFTFPNGTQICEVEVDEKTGVVDVVRFVAVDDFGNILNPMIVEGQVHGGLAQGIGQALMEHAIYDEDSGQLVTGSFLDYAMPRASDLPSFEVSYHEDAPCTHNPLGVKGCGEAGTIGSATAVMNAVLHALEYLDVKHMDMPASPNRVWHAIRAAKSAAQVSEGTAQ